MDSAEVIDHVGQPGDPYRVTIMRLARKNETYELRWRENVRQDDGSITRKRCTGRGGYTKGTAYTKADKVYLSLERTNGRIGEAERQRREPKEAKRPPTFQELCQKFLDSHTGKRGTIEGYESLLRNNVYPELPYTDHTSRPRKTRTVHLAPLPAPELTQADVQHWISAARVKPDNRRKLNPQPISTSTIDSCLTAIKSVLNWGVANHYLTENVAAPLTIDVYDSREVEWFRTPDDFWPALHAIQAKWGPDLANFLITLAYMGLRVRELSALTYKRVDFTNHRAMIRESVDRKQRPSTVKRPESQQWMPLHAEAEKALLAQRNAAGTRARPDELVFRGPRGGMIGPTLVNTALTHGCAETKLTYRVTGHGLRHSLACWLKDAGVHTADIQTVLRHTDPRTTAGYLHTDEQGRRDAINTLPTRS